MTVTITIDGKKIKAQEHQSVLDVAQLNGIEIPTLCYHKHLSIDGSCRLCSVEVNGMNGFQMACALQVNDGMDVRTDTPELLFGTQGVKLSNQTWVLIRWDVNGLQGWVPADNIVTRANQLQMIFWEDHAKIGILACVFKLIS
jgi:uncharacterized 2Fe-2S/4Fe-4S cluster protein (DUF4445 family)